MINYFSLSSSYEGEIIFRISKHLSKDPIWVMKNKFAPGIKFLWNKYHLKLKEEQKQIKEFNEKQYNNNFLT